MVCVCARQVQARLFVHAAGALAAAGVCRPRVKASRGRSSTWRPH